MSADCLLSSVCADVATLSHGSFADIREVRDGRDVRDVREVRERYSPHVEEIKYTNNSGLQHLSMNPIRFSETT